MSLEATMILVDNSDWARNGDYLPTRWEAQLDAVGIVANTKFNAHAENTVGLMTMAGKQTELILTPVNDSGKLLASLHGIKLSGNLLFSKALQIAQLALKHRINTNQRQRILAFIASPVSEDENNLINLAKKFKKNNVAVDIIYLGGLENNEVNKLKNFVENVNNTDNSHFLNVNPGINLLSDSLYGTPILAGGDFEMGENAGNYGGNMGGGQEIDPNMDPDLAMALRISLEEDKERQRKLKEEEDKKKEEEQKIIEEHPVEQSQIPVENTFETPIQVSIPEKMNIEEKIEDLEDLDEAELLERAKELSLQENPLVVENKEKPKDEKEKLFQDEDFVNELIKMIPNADENSEEIKKAVELLKKGKEEQKKEEQKKEDEK